MAVTLLKASTTSGSVKICKKAKNEMEKRKRAELQLEQQIRTKTREKTKKDNHEMESDVGVCSDNQSSLVLADSRYLWRHRAAGRAHILGLGSTSLQIVSFAQTNKVVSGDRRTYKDMEGLGQEGCGKQ